MKICLFISGYIRTLFYGFHKNFEIIKNKIPEATIDVCYSFWDQNNYSSRINDPWHFKVEEKVFDISKELIDEYFYNVGFERVLGEIEAFSVSQSIMNESPFIEAKKSLSSQYYKVYRAVSQYFSNDYDLYVTIRPDVILHNFVNAQQVDELNLKNGIVVNKNYWYNALYTGKDCNEYVWLSTENNCVSSNSQFLNLNTIIPQIGEQYGEVVTGQHFNNLLSSGKINSIDTFDFDYRVVR